MNSKQRRQYRRKFRYAVSVHPKNIYKAFRWCYEKVGRKNFLQSSETFSFRSQKMAVIFSLYHS